MSKYLARRALFALAKHFGHDAAEFCPMRRQGAFEQWHAVVRDVAQGAVLIAGANPIVAIHLGDCRLVRGRDHHSNERGHCLYCGGKIGCRRGEREEVELTVNGLYPGK